MCQGQMVFIRREAGGYLSLTDDFLPPVSCSAPIKIKGDHKYA